MTEQQAREIIQHVVDITKPRWIEYDQTWSDIDRIFIRHGYEQQGFEIFKFVPLLEARGIFSIDALGSIFTSYDGERKYARDYAGSLDSPFYEQLSSGAFGKEGVLFCQSVNDFLVDKLGRPGRGFWRLLWMMLIACNHLKKQYQSSFRSYMLGKYGRHVGKDTIEDLEFLSQPENEWKRFLEEVQPWTELAGIGVNVFDFIFGDIVEANFVSNSYKFDSANEHFLTVTGISEEINPFTRETTIKYLQALDLPYTLRQINKGMYTYSSRTEEANFGFCRSSKKCVQCGVNSICKKRIGVG